MRGFKSHQWHIHYVTSPPPSLLPASPSCVRPSVPSFVTPCTALPPHNDRRPHALEPDCTTSLIPLHTERARTERSSSMSVASCTAHRTVSNTIPNSLAAESRPIGWLAADMKAHAEMCGTAFAGEGPCTQFALLRCMPHFLLLLHIPNHRSAHHENLMEIAGQTSLSYHTHTQPHTRTKVIPTHTAHSEVSARSTPGSVTTVRCISLSCRRHADWLQARVGRPSDAAQSIHTAAANTTHRCDARASVYHLIYCLLDSASAACAGSDEYV
jgi:hypothetical protein